MAASPWLDGLERDGLAQGDLGLERRAAESPTAIAAKLRCELAVIGGGIAGLHAALRAAQLGRDVILLEANYCGYGASGRNAGHLTPTIGKDLPSLGLMYRRDKARRLVALAEAAVRFTEATLVAHEIDAHYEPVGNLLAAVHEGQLGALQRAFDWGRALGAQVEWVSPQQRAASGLPACVHAAVRESVGGILDPARYVEGLRRACLRAGVRVFEGCPATKLVQREHQVHVSHMFGELIADQLVVANNAFAPQLGVLRGRMVPLFVQLFRTSVLSPPQLEALNWGARSGIYTAHEMLESYRLTADNRIVGGAKMVRYAFGSKVLNEVDPNWARRFESIFAQRFADLQTPSDQEPVRIESHWGGPIAMTLDFLPAVGRLADRPRIAYALAFAGHGVALAGYCGRQASDELLGQTPLNPELLEHQSLWIPPEPFRYLTARSLLGLFAWMDAGLDRRIAASNKPPGS